MKRDETHEPKPHANDGSDVRLQLGDADETLKVLSGRGIPAKLIKDAIETVSADTGRFTVFNMLDALTRSTRKFTNAGDRIEQDARIGSLLALAV